ncbi:DUF552 domain-containing protein [bacterium 3DAC]|jgi:FtsZ-interacting cell division protein YlmF|nr:cell division protein SepF [Dictyoglomota bacterium]UZN23343.1 DUF552 domain-containing protein [bacterium 3DAC]
MGVFDFIKNWLQAGYYEDDEVADMEDEEFEEEYRKEESVNYTEGYATDYSSLAEKTVFIYRAQVFEDVRYVKPVMKQDIPVIVDLSEVMEKDDRRRFLDFAWGMAKAGGGRIKVLDTKDLMYAIILPSEHWGLVDEVSPSFSEPEDVDEGAEE